MYYPKIPTLSTPVMPNIGFPTCSTLTAATTTPFLPQRRRQQRPFCPLSPFWRESLLLNSLSLFSAFPPPPPHCHVWNGLAHLRSDFVSGALLSRLRFLLAPYCATLLIHYVHVDRGRELGVVVGAHWIRCCRN